MAKLENHRGLGGALLLPKQRIVSQNQVDARRFDIAERTDGVLELALEGALVVDLLVELRAHPVRLVEYLKTHPAAFQASLGRSRQAGFVQLARRHPDARAAVDSLEGNLRLR